MSKLIEQNQPKKSRFLKYSLLASISVGAIIAMPFEGMAMSINPLFLDALNKKLLNGLSQSNENKDTTNTPQQIGKVMTVSFEGVASSGSTESLVSLSREDHYNSIKNNNAINILKKRPKSFGASDNKKKRPPTRSKTFVGSEKIEQSQNTYTSEPTVQTLQKPEIIITASSPTVSPASNSFVTAPTIQNTTLLSAPQSPEHIYQNTPPSTTVSSPSTPYQPTPKSKPNDGVRANTLQKPKAARKISFSEPQQTVQPSKSTVPPIPTTPVPLPIKKSSTEVAVEIISPISGYRENAANKLSSVTTAIEKTSDQKARKKAQDIKKQIISQRKNIQKIDISVNKVVLTKPQEKAPVTEIPKAGLFLNQQQQLDMLTQQQRVNAARQAEVNRKKAEANEVKRNSAEYKDLINERGGVQLEQNQQYIAAEKTKKQQQAENKQRSEREKKRKERNHQKEKARDIVNIREDIVAKMQQILNTDTTLQITLHKLQELKAGAIEDKKKKQEAQNLLSEIKKQEKAIKTAADKAQGILEKAEKETSRTEIQKLQTKMNGYYETVTNGKIAVDIQNLERLVLTPSTTSSSATIYNKAKPIMPLTLGVQGILGKQPEDEDGYLVPIKAQPQTYITMLPTDPKSMDSGLGSRTSDTEFSSNHNSNKAYENLSPIEPENEQQHETAQESDGRYKSAMDNSLQQLMSLVTQDGEKSFMYAAEQAAKITNSDIQSMVLSQLFKLQDTQQKGNSYGGIPNNDDNLSILSNFEEKSAVLQTTITDESLRSDKNWKNPAPYSSSPEFDKKQSEYLDLADNISTQNPKQSDILEALDLITPKQKTTAAKSDSLRKSNVSGSIPEIQQPQSEKMHTETLDMQNDLGLDLHSQEGRFDSGFFGSLESQNLSSAYDFDQLSASWDAAYNQRMNANAKDAPQKTLTENSASSEKKQGSIIKRAVLKVRSILQTNDAENRKRKRDGETSKQSTVDQEAGFGQDWENEYHKEPSLSVDSGLIKKAAHLISLLDAKRTEIQQTTSPLQQKSPNSALQEIENDCQEVIKISQELQQILIHRPENAKAERKLDDIKNRADKHFSNIETDADVGFNPNWGNSHSMPTANINSLSKNLAVTSPINVGSLYNSPQAQQFREDHKNIIINTINSISSSGVPKESIDPTIIKSLPYLDNDQYQEVVLRVDRVHDINTRGYLLSKLKQLRESEVRELTGVYASIYNTTPPEVLGEAVALLDRPQGRLNLVDSTIKKGTQPLSNLSTIYEPVSYENLAPETIYKTEQPKPSISYKNTSKQKLPIPLFRSAELDKKLDYLDLEDKLLKVEEARIVKEKQAIATLNQYQDPENLEFQRLAIEALDLSSKESQLKEKRKAIEAGFSLNEEYSSTDVSSSSSYSVGDISSLLSDTESNLSRSPSVSSLNDLSSSNIMKLKTTLEGKKFYINKNQKLFLELWRKDNYDPLLTDLGNQIFKGEQEIQKLEEEKKILEDKVTPNSLMDKALRRSPSVSSLNSLSSDKDLLWDNTGDIGASHSAEYSCSTPKPSSYVSDKNLSEKLARLRVYQKVKIDRKKELEQLLSTSSEADQIAQQIEEVKKGEEIIRKTIDTYLANPSMLNDVSFEEIDENLKQLGAGIPESVMYALESEAQEDPEAILDGSTLQKMLSSNNDTTIDSLPSGDEEQEDTEVTESGIQKAGDKGLLALPVSSNDCALALSDCREKECLALGDGSKDEEDDEGYNSGSEEEEETIEQLSDSDGGNLETTAIDTAISLEQEAKKEMQTQISENAPTLNQAKVVNSIVNNMIRNRLDASINMSNNMVAVGAGDEEEVRIKRGLWVRGMYGINNHGRVENINGYRGTNKGATIGFDVEIDNNIVGIAYSNVHSVFKFKNSKNNDKEIIDSHVVSIYGQKELPKDFALQALVSASKNFIKDKTTYSYGDNKIRSNVKHRNHSYNAEALLNYNYLVKNNLVITPNIGLRYGKSRDGVYNETGINVQEIALTMKENNILSGIVGTKVKVPLKDALKFNNLGLTFQGAVEHNFKEKTQRINRVVKIFDTEFKQNYAIPKQPKTSYNLGTGIMGSIKNTTISLDYNYYLNKHYRSHQGSVKLKVNL